MGRLVNALRSMSVDERSRLLAQENLIADATELICVIMLRQGVTRKELAQRLGKSAGHVTQLLSGERNMTLRTLADLASALDCRLTVQEKL